MSKTVHRMSSPDVFSKKAVLLQICRIFTEEYQYRTVISVELNQRYIMFLVELTLLHGCSPVNWKNVEHLS